MIILEAAAGPGGTQKNFWLQTAVLCLNEGKSYRFFKQYLEISTKSKGTIAILCIILISVTKFVYLHFASLAPLPSLSFLSTEGLIYIS